MKNPKTQEQENKYFFKSFVKLFTLHLHRSFPRTEIIRVFKKLSCYSDLIGFKVKMA